MLYDPYCAPASSRTTQPSTGRAVYTAVISDKCTFLRGKCKRSPYYWVMRLLAGTLVQHLHSSGMTAVYTALAGTLFSLVESRQVFLSLSYICV